MDWTSGVAMQFALRTLDPQRNRLKRNGYVEACARVALLADLVRFERVTGPNELEITTTATGFAPADKLLAAIDDDPHRSLGWWIGRGPAVQFDLAAEWVAAKRWQRTRGTLGFGHSYLDLKPGAVSRASELQARASRIADGEDAPESDIEAAVVALVLIAEFAFAADPPACGRVPNALRDACGAMEWVIGCADEFLAQSRITDAIADSDRQAAGSS